MLPLTWLANELLRTGIGMKAGQTISTGTLTGMLRPKPGETYVAEFGPFGRSRAVAISGALLRKIAKEIRQLDRKLSQPRILFEQAPDIARVLNLRLIFAKYVDLVEQGR